MKPKELLCREIVLNIESMCIAIFYVPYIITDSFVSHRTNTPTKSLALLKDSLENGEQSTFWKC